MERGSLNKKMANLRSHPIWKDDDTSKCSCPCHIYVGFWNTM